MNSLIEEQLKVKNNNDRIPNLTNEDLIELAPFSIYLLSTPFTLPKILHLDGILSFRINLGWFPADHLRAI
jgi:hypothetical protein